MKSTLQLIPILLLLLTFSCKEKKNESQTTGTEKQTEQKISVVQTKDSVVEKKEVPKHYEHKYVIAKSGLNYRDKPNGKILGKFPLNTSLRLVEHTKISDTINDGGKLIVGKWVGVQNWVLEDNETDTVYVFNGFLSNNYIESDIKLYYTSSFYREQNGNVRTAFLNVSETYFENAYNESEDRNGNSILKDKDLKKDTIRLNKNQRNKLLKFLNISESDKVFIYSITQDKIKAFHIKDLPAIACYNIYGSFEDYGNIETDYEFGFDLGKKINESDWSDNLTFIGKENPFEIGKLQPIIWKKTENNQFPVINEQNENDDYRVSYKFETKEYNYFLQKASKSNLCNHLVIIDKESNSEVFNKLYCYSEGTSPTEIITDSDKNEKNHQSQWTGKLFKDKPSIVFGFQYFSFGCESINFITETEPSIEILCDNRH